ncbi:MAG: AAA domain-containing protein [Luteolibacter sp.]
MNEAEEFRRGLERQIRDEAKHGWDKARKQWSKPLGERVDACRAIGNLEISHVEVSGKRRVVHFDPSVQDMAFFREGDKVRMSLNNPGGDDSIEATFLGLTDKGLAVTVPSEAEISITSGWSLDEQMIDLSEIYLKALAEMATTAHGRDVVLPALMGGKGDEVDFDAHSEFSESLEDSGLDESQVDAVATCLATDRFHLVQGPPGTGKTQTLAKLVGKLVEQGQRVLLTSFTHRAIHHALRKVTATVDCPVYKVSDSIPSDVEGIEFRDNFAETGLLDHDGPYVIGATPFALFSSRLEAVRFDVAVIDETSQMCVAAAVMPMLRAQRWFFFGDRQQLPPVVQRRVEDAAADSVFAILAKNGGHTMLNITYRMNGPLTCWPSENFYHGKLVAARANDAHRFRLKSEPAMAGLLGPEPAMVRVELDHEGNRALSPEEADETAALIEEMLNGGLPPTEIGVVVPFRAQAARVRHLLRFKRFAGWPDIGKIAVDTVERFQGQEREAMIVSFVVSDVDFMNRLASFLTYPQRLNVAVTRARTKVVLIHSRRFHHWLTENAAHNEQAALALSLLDAAIS